MLPHSWFKPTMALISTIQLLLQFPFLPLDCYSKVPREIPSPSCMLLTRGCYFSIFHLKHPGDVFTKFCIDILLRDNSAIYRQGINLPFLCKIPISGDLAEKNTIFENQFLSEEL